MAISPAHLARLEAGKRGLYVRDFVSIAEALGEKPGNLLPNDVGAMGQVKPIVDRLAAVPPELLPQVSAIVADVVLFAESLVVAVASVPESSSASRVERAVDMNSSGRRLNISKRTRQRLLWLSRRAQPAPPGTGGDDPRPLVKSRRHDRGGQV